MLCSSLCALEVRARMMVAALPSKRMQPTSGTFAVLHRFPKRRAGDPQQRCGPSTPSPTMMTCSRGSGQQTLTGEVSLSGARMHQADHASWL